MLASIMLASSDIAIETVHSAIEVPFEISLFLSSHRTHIVQNRGWKIHTAAEMPTPSQQQLINHHATNITPKPKTRYADHRVPKIQISFDELFSRASSLMPAGIVSWPQGPGRREASPASQKLSYNLPIIQNTKKTQRALSPHPITLSRSSKQQDLLQFSCFICPFKSNICCVSAPSASIISSYLSVLLGSGIPIDLASAVALM
jgi:hypothetical protein